MKVSRSALVTAIAVPAVLLAGCGSNDTSAATTSAATAPAIASAAPPSGSGSASGSAGPSVPATSSGAGSSADREQYCEQSGGQVQVRGPFWNTNGDPSQWLALGGSATMCRFQADDQAKSRIYVDLTTLSSTDPTLAGLAYLSKVPMPPSTGGANPATGYCSNQLHASSSFGGGAAGGGWVAESDPDDVVVSLCVFPDGSFVDEWGLAYHSAGDVRGADLTTVMRYQPSGALPPVFPVAQVQPTS